MIFTAAETTLPLSCPHDIHRRRRAYSISLRSYEVTKIMLACGGTYVLLSPVTA